MKVILATTRSWHLGHTSLALSHRNSLRLLLMADKKPSLLPPQFYKRCWPYHAAMKFFYHFTSQILEEKATYAMIGLWSNWLRIFLRSSRCPHYDVAHAIMGFGTELFDEAEKRGALKVLDCPNSHPTTYYGFWQRECDLWCPGERVPIPQWMFARMNRELERADCILVQSDFCRDSMVLNGIPEKKIFINPMGVDTSLFNPQRSVPTKPIFISVGTICLRKGHQYLFRAFEIVKRKLPDAELICVGDYKSDFRRERKKWEGSFTHIPHIPHSEIAQLLTTCTAFVFPSQEEGIARAQIEALAAGLPVIGTHEGGATTLVRDGIEGFIVRGRDPQHIADSMIRVFHNPESNRKMGEAAHAKGAVKNTWQDYGDRLLEEYRRRLTTFKCP
jgi:glycosyltransferase involved in cell wall biosynthesis